MGLFFRTNEPKEVEVQVDRDDFKKGDRGKAYEIHVDEQIVTVSKDNGCKAFFSTDEVKKVEE